MLQTVPKWHVVVEMANGQSPKPRLEFWVFESSLANVQQLVAKLQFTPNGLVQPARITISACEDPVPQFGAVTTHAG